MRASDSSVPLYFEEGEFYGILPYAILTYLSFFSFS